MKRVLTNGKFFLAVGFTYLMIALFYSALGLLCLLRGHKKEQGNYQMKFTH